MNNTLQNLIGRTDLHRALLTAVATGRVSHAYILSGPAGSGKRTLARAFAMSLLCSSPRNGAPCGRCANCVKCRAGGHPDLMVLEGEGKADLVKIDAIRRLRADAYIRPNDAGRKVYIICGADRMQAPAQNALLKIFEEPPEYAVILLLAENARRLLPTIRSRAAVLPLTPLSDTELSALLRRECPQADPSAAARAAALAGGNPGVALLAASDRSFQASLSLGISFLRALSGDGLYDLLLLAPALSKNRETMLDFAARLAPLLRLCIEQKNGGAPLPAALADELAPAVGRLTNPALVHIMNLLPELTSGVRSNGSLSLLAQSFLIRSWRFTH